MNFAVFTVMLPDLTPEEAAPALKDAGYQGVEWRVTATPAEVKDETPSFWRNNSCTLAPTPQDAQRARTIAEAVGLAIPNLGTYIAVGDLPAVEQAMQFAALAGAPSIRVGIARNDQVGDVHALFEQSVAFLGGVQTLSQRLGVKALIEMHHGTIAASASSARRLVEGFDPACIGVIHDCGNMVFEGHEEYRRGLELLGPYLAHVHVKNAAYDRPSAGGVWQPRWAPLQDGVVDFAALFAALHSVGYDGWIVVEDFSQAYDSHTALHENLAFLHSVQHALS
ncbi:MAG: sugar phosphate isomerase/epimerase [Caldilinea sp.]|uniref:sugar phosphate isomerase/epimerase family protein n=1 Tax=Caldilinea sp. TaxID=2293560 RepID=UPI002CB57638|nr:sugar phosphate isomerase/epimerase [Anaerolineales bacterium]HQY94369.1 sugar phosphate isomerase/epimerase [Caldilinea sp.]